MRDGAVSSMLGRCEELIRSSYNLEEAAVHAMCICIYTYICIPLYVSFTCIDRALLLVSLPC